MSGGFIERYFAAEQGGATWLIAIGVLACLAACALLWRRHPWRGMAWPLLLVGALQIALGVTTWQRSDAQAQAALRQHAGQPVSFRIVETQRLHGVLDRLELARRAALGVLGLGMALAVALRQRPFWLAFAVGLVLQAAAVLSLDHLAQDRARQYLAALRASPSDEPPATGHPP